MVLKGRGRKGTWGRRDVAAKGHGRKGHGRKDTWPAGGSAGMAGRADRSHSPRKRHRPRIGDIQARWGGMPWPLIHRCTRANPVGPPGFLPRPGARAADRPAALDRNLPRGMVAMAGLIAGQGVSPYRPEPELLEDAAEEPHVRSPMPSAPDSRLPATRRRGLNSNGTENRRNRSAPVPNKVPRWASLRTWRKPPCWRPMTGARKGTPYLAPERFWCLFQFSVPCYSRPLRAINDHYGPSSQGVPSSWDRGQSSAADGLILTLSAQIDSPSSLLDIVRSCTLRNFLTEDSRASFASFGFASSFRRVDECLHGLEKVRQECQPFQALNELLLRKRKRAPYTHFEVAEGPLDLRRLTHHESSPSPN